MSVYYRRRPPRKKIYHYFLPFVLILIIVGGLYYVWQRLGGDSYQNPIDLTTEKVSLDIEEGSVKAMAVNSNSWQNAPDGIDFYRGEKIKTGFDGLASLTFFDASTLRLNHDTSLVFSKLAHKNETDQILVEVNEGDVWVQVDHAAPQSYLKLKTDQLLVTLHSATVALSSPGTVYLIKGSAEVDIMDGKKVLTTKTLGVGQQLNVDVEIINGLSEGLNETLVYAFSDLFKGSDWYKWNMKKDSGVDAFESTDSPDDDSNPDPVLSDDDLLDTVSVDSPVSGTTTNKSTLTIQGTLDSDSIDNIYVQSKKATIAGGTWKIYDFSLTREGKNELTLEAEDSSGERHTLDPLVIYYDNIPPTTPQITDPGENGDTVTIEDVEQEMLGTVDSDTHAVIVNDYQLSKYVSGSKDFSYFAKMAYGNLEVGENEYIIYAKDKAGNLSEPATITLVLDQETVDNADEVPEEDEDSEEDEEDTEAETLPESSSEGGVEITAPNDGVSFKTSETQFEIQGNVPEGAVSVEVDDYELQAFSEGDTTFKYRASSSMGNLDIGAQNTYTVTAYDDTGDVLGSASITIDVESGSMGDPTIDIPSANPYETTLNEIVVGGAVGKWVEKIYVNGEKVHGYIPGSGKWRETVELVLGENVFNIYGEKQGENTKTVSVTIIYKP